jgi:hypothetical protein
MVRKWREVPFARDMVNSTAALLQDHSLLTGQSLHLSAAEENWRAASFFIRRNELAREPTNDNPRIMQKMGSVGVM